MGSVERLELHLDKIETEIKVLQKQYLELPIKYIRLKSGKDLLETIGKKRLKRKKMLHDLDMLINGSFDFL